MYKGISVYKSESKSEAIELTREVIKSVNK
jgi:hypothetical protein